MTFEDLGLHEPLLRAIREERYTDPTPIQEQAIPPVLEGKDILGCAQTGTGKTAAFALPILQRLAARSGQQEGPRAIRALVLAPTRELAAQIGESFAAYGRHTGLRRTVVFGGVGQGPQCQALQRGVDILVATPGRLLDLLGQKRLTLRTVEVLVLDEADRMLDMGFIHDIRRILALLPARRQTLLFSATMPADIRELADAILDRPVRVSITPEAPAAETVAQSVYFVDRPGKQDLLQRLLGQRHVLRALVFTRTKRGADRVARRLQGAGIGAEAIHGDKSQGARQRALEGFRGGATRVLVASDIAARGIDVDGISHVINYDMPVEAETYVHRIGRTGRAGAVGCAISMCDAEERAALRDIERLTGRTLTVVRSAEHPAATDTPRPVPQAPKAPQAPRRFRRRGRRGGASTVAAAG